MTKKAENTARRFPDPPPAEPPAKPATMTAHEVAERLGVGYNTVWIWERAGKMPSAVRLTRRAVRFNTDEIEAFARGEWKAPEAAETSEA